MNIELSTKRDLTHAASQIQGPHFTDLLGCELGHTMPFSSRTAIRPSAHPMTVASGHSLLVDGIGHVVLLSAEEKVVRSDTQPDVAVMADLHVRRNLAERQQPCRSMSANHPSICAEDFSITVSILAASPQPARLTFPNHWPEAIGQRGTLTPHCVSSDESHRFIFKEASVAPRLLRRRRLATTPALTQSVSHRVSITPRLKEEQRWRGE